MLRDDCFSGWLVVFVERDGFHCFDSVFSEIAPAFMQASQERGKIVGILLWVAVISVWVFLSCADCCCEIGCDCIACCLAQTKPS